MVDDVVQKQRQNFIENPAYIFNSFTIDWLRFSVLTHGFDSVCALFDVSISPEDWMDGRRYGYDFFTMPIEGVIVAAEGLPGEFGLPGDRFIVDMSGNGLAYFFSRHEAWADMRSFFQWLVGLPGMKVNRLDIALDCRERRWMTVRKVNNYFHQGRIRARWSRKTQNYMKGGRGETFYWGSREGDSFLRVYDKRAEQLSRGVDEAELPPFWTRLELELKGQTATVAATKLHGLGVSSSSLAGIVRGFVEFLAADSSSKQRAGPVDWWKRLLKDAEAVPIRLPKRVKSLYKTSQWVRRQVSPSLAMLTEASEGDVTWFYESLADGRERLRPDQWAMIETFIHGG